MSNAPIHLAFDLVAWISAAIGARVMRRFYPVKVERLAQLSNTSYFISLAMGALLGAWFFGSLNSLSWEHPTFSHSIAGALVGGIGAVEVWKFKSNIKESTGITFVIPLCIGIIIGRIGCFVSGLEDQTYGIESSVPWAVDMGDGMRRHPVALYESISMLAFLVAFLSFLSRATFYWFTSFYAVQRFIWEFLKPYPPFWLGLNVFHWLMLLLLLYSFTFSRNLKSTT